MKLENIKRVYLIGIGGIGMSALARYFKNRGSDVFGYDKTPTALTGVLEEEGINISFADELQEIPALFNIPDSNTLIIYTPAIPEDCKILNFFRNASFSLKKRSEVIGIISKGMFTIAVAGTHGKTTTSSIIAHILKDSGYDCYAFLGGIASNYNSNFLVGNNNTLVVEADEYDRSFLTLHPDISVITSMDADHLDIYGDQNHLTRSFQLFASQLKKDGTLIRRKGLDLETGLSYAANEDADVYAFNIRITDGNFWFNFKNNSVSIENIQFNLPGLHNIENCVAAIEVALKLGIFTERIKEAVGNFKGVKRRFEYVIRNEKHVYIDDYAHHPAELKACILAVKSLYPDKKLTLIFQPHLFSRTRDFADGFAEALSSIDQLIMLDIYPAREIPIEGVSSKMILDKISGGSNKVYGKQETIDLIRFEKPELLVTAGAGDIDMLVKPLKNILENA